MSLFLRCLFVVIGCFFIGKGILGNNYAFAFIALFIMAAVAVSIPSQESREGDKKKTGLYF